MDGSALYPRGHHPVWTDCSPDIVEELKPLLRMDHPVKYFYVDFGLSVRFEPSASPYVVGDVGRDAEVPELSSTVPYDAFKADIYALGNLFDKEFVQVCLLYYFDRYFRMPYYQTDIANSEVPQPRIPMRTRRCNEATATLSATDCGRTHRDLPESSEDTGSLRVPLATKPQVSARLRTALQRHRCSRKGRVESIAPFRSTYIDLTQHVRTLLFNCGGCCLLNYSLGTSLFPGYILPASRNAICCRPRSGTTCPDIIIKHVLYTTAHHNASCTIRSGISSCSGWSPEHSVYSCLRFAIRLKDTSSGDREHLTVAVC